MTLIFVTSEKSPYTWNIRALYFYVQNFKNNTTNWLITKINDKKLVIIDDQISHKISLTDLL